MRPTTLGSTSPVRSTNVRRACLLALFAVVAVAAACETVPVTGRSQLNLLSEAEESKLGGEAFTQVLAKSKVSPEFLSTHPSDENRIRQIEGRLPQALAQYKPR